jgi:hypothetical protein
MKKSIVSLVAVCVFLALGAAAFADDFSGKWSLSRTNASGETIGTQSIEVKDGKFIFRITKGGDTIFYAHGDFKLQTLDAIKVISFDHIIAGATEGDTKPSDDVRQCVYVLEEDTLTFAIDFDKNRGKSPRIEVYHRVKS